MSLTLALSDGYSLTLTPPPPTGRQIAQAAIAKLATGGNFERLHWRDLRWRDKPIDRTPGYWRELLETGWTHSRCFMPFGFSGGESILQKADAQAFMPLLSTAIGAGQVMFIDMIGVLQIQEARANAAQIEDWLATNCDMIAAQGFPIGSIIVGSVNEAADKQNADWGPILLHYHSILRAKLPRHLLSFSSADWGGYGGPTALNSYDGKAGVTDGTLVLPANDDLIVVGMHDYDSVNAGASADSAATWAVADQACAAWSAAHDDIPVVATEYAWVDPLGIIAAARGMGRLRPMLWCVTTGTFGRVNISSTDATLRPDVAAAVAQAACIIRASA